MNGPSKLRSPPTSTMNSISTDHCTPKLVRGRKVIALASQTTPASAAPKAAST